MKARRRADDFFMRPHSTNPRLTEETLITSSNTLTYLLYNYTPFSDDTHDEMTLSGETTIVSFHINAPKLWRHFNIWPGWLLSYRLFKDDSYQHTLQKQATEMSLSYADINSYGDDKSK